MQWNSQGTALAIGGVQTASTAAGEKKDVGMVQFYSPTGMLALGPSLFEGIEYYAIVPFFIILVAKECQVLSAGKNQLNFQSLSGTEM